ncbi:Thiosulfate sulfurtransferase/rhodanese-like domain-containing protein 3 [Geodia barretti]|uniref:Thiosulfate sulfurtransferase/rhodanese-like domain-containing protein 3 n=1 Tax=Geodia barretti TaxID=519541 RepID=A0AA35R518_GEOBA|nr:Thiosulfate sulfurtransferase/rhodanese-like domain-containing protein 3 [Geodia barretti]
MSCLSVLTRSIGSLRCVYALFLASPSLEQRIPTANHSEKRTCGGNAFPKIRRSFFYTTSATSPEIDTAELAELVRKGEVQLIDVREPWELEDTGTVAPNTINIPLGKVEEALQVTPEHFQESYNALQPKKHRDIVFYCMAGVRSLVALQTAQDLGYTNVRHYIRGWLGWQIHMDHQKNGKDEQNAT